MSERCNILILTHGNLGEAFVETSKMFVPDRNEICALGLYPTMKVEDFKQQVEAKLQEIGDNTVILTDIFGGSPANVAASLLAKKYYPVVTGLNLGMVIEGLLNNQNTKADLAKIIENAGNASIVDVNSKLKSKNR